MEEDLLNAIIFLAAAFLVKSSFKEWYYDDPVNGIS